MPSIEEYVDMGYSGIVVLACETHERQSGMQEEVTRERIACRDRQGKYLELVVVTVEHPLKRTSFRIDERRLLTREQYTEYVAKHGVRDTERFYREREARREAVKVAKGEIERLTPICPACGAKMVIRINRQNGNHFWGCSTFSWSNCRGTRDISVALAVRLDRLNAIVSGTR